MGITLNGRVLDFDSKPSLQTDSKPVWRMPIELNSKLIYGVNINGYDYPPCDTGCVLYLPGLPGQGSTIWDRSNQGNNGTITGAVWTRNSQGIWYLDFDALDDSINCGSGASLDNINTITIKLWFYVKAWGVASVYGRLWDKTIRSLMINNENQAIRYEHGFVNGGNNYPNWQTPNSSIALTTWYHLIVTYDRTATANNPIIYLNGVSQVLTESAVPVGATRDDSAGTLYIGNTSGANRGANSRIALHATCNTIWTAAQALASFQREKHLLGV